MAIPWRREWHYLHCSDCISSAALVTTTCPGACRVCCGVVKAGVYLNLASVQLWLSTSMLSSIRAVRSIESQIQLDESSSDQSSVARRRRRCASVMQADVSAPQWARLCVQGAACVTVQPLVTRTRWLWGPPQINQTGVAVKQSTCHPDLGLGQLS